MKSFLTILFVALFAVSASAQWTFVKYFPNASQTFSGTGINNGLVVDRDGKIWLQTQATADSLDTGGGVYKKHGVIRIYNPNGTEVAFSPIKIYKGGSIEDTLGVSGYGLALDHEGNILSVNPSSRIYRINYKTGAAMASVISPIPGYTSSMVTPAVTSSGEIVVGPVVPGNKIVILNSDFTSQGTTIDDTTGDFARAVAVTPDGNDVYFPHFGKQEVIKYHSDNGTFGPYTIADTVMKGLCVETTVWDKNGKLWVTGGNAVSGLPKDTRYSGYAWYAWDPATKTIVDSIKWSGDVSVDPRPRGIAFSVTGDTAWVAAFNANDSCVQMFTKGPNSIQREDALVATQYSLSQNYPNPFNPSTQIKFSLLKSTSISLKVYDVLGKEVATLAEGTYSEGVYSVNFDANRLSAGMFFYTLKTSDGFVETKKMLLLK